VALRTFAATQHFIIPLYAVQFNVLISNPYRNPLDDALEETERNQILKILSETRWRIEGTDGAAAILGLHPSTLRARMHKLGLFRPETKESD
jgi:formate hydrogenlyase transcriptional activator